MIELKKSYGKVLAVLTLLCLLLSFGTVTANAAGNAKVAVSSATVERGASASVSFNLEGNPGIWGLKLRVHYDHSALTLNSVTTGNVFDAGELQMSENLNKDPYVIVASANSLQNKTANGTIVTLQFAVSGSAAFTSYPITVEVAQANNVAGEKVSVGAQNGSITVVSCVHADKEWRVTKAAKCEEAGSETLTCKKCETTFETRTINATGHQHTEVRNAAAATKTAEGYTGDTYCKDCGKMIAKGKTIAKLKSDPPATKPPVTNPPATKAPTTKAPGATNAPATKAPEATNAPTTKAPSATDEVRPSPSDVPEIISGKNAIFNKNSKVSLVFVSNADFSEFIRVEIDRKPLSEKDFTVKSGSTVVTVNSDCLNKLSVGKHTVSVISTGGSADTEFTVQEGSGNSGTATATPNPAPEEKSSAGLVVIVILLVLLAGGAGAFLFIKKRRDAE